MLLGTVRRAHGALVVVDGRTLLADDLCLEHAGELAERVGEALEEMQASASISKRLFDSVVRGGGEA